MPLEINRAPVLTLWAAVVAERLGRPREERAHSLVLVLLVMPGNSRRHQA